jgi:UPF0716 family protein affecting phage T7 exclusion
MTSWERWCFGIGAILFIAPGVKSGLVGLLIAAPAIFAQLIRFKKETRLTTA